ncbi:TPA: hypothetical protein H1008_01460 [archaeon]|nr:hypothetical protein [Candidatus Undinarchaeales archaeon SRR5007147.bin71]
MNEEEKAKKYVKKLESEDEVDEHTEKLMIHDSLEDKKPKKANKARIQD